MRAHWTHAHTTAAHFLLYCAIAGGCIGALTAWTRR